MLATIRTTPWAMVCLGVVMFLSPVQDSTLHVGLSSGRLFPVSRFRAVLETMSCPLRLQNSPVRVLSRNCLPDGQSDIDVYVSAV